MASFCLFSFVANTKFTKTVGFQPDSNSDRRNCRLDQSISSLFALSNLPTFTSPTGTVGYEHMSSGVRIDCYVNCATITTSV